MERLRVELAVLFNASSPVHVVLGSSASGLFQAWLDFMERKWFDLSFSWEGVSHWPLFKNWIKYRFRSSPTLEGQKIRIVTDIGGSRMPDMVDGGVLFHDACHGWRVGPLADFTLLSFYPTKLCGGAEGGALLCKDLEEAEQIQVLANCGLDSMGKRPDFERMDTRGRKANMTDVAAALNREALTRLPLRVLEIETAWYGLFDIFEKAGGETERVLPQPKRPYLFQVSTSDVETARDLADRAGIGSQVNFPPAPFVTLPCYPMTTHKMRQVAAVAVDISKL